MPDWQDTVDHIRHIDILKADLERWEATARRLEPLATASPRRDLRSASGSVQVLAVSSSVRRAVRGVNFGRTVEDQGRGAGRRTRAAVGLGRGISLGQRTGGQVLRAFPQLLRPQLEFFNLASLLPVLILLSSRRLCCRARVG